MTTETQKATVEKSYRVTIQTRYHADTGRISARHLDNKKVYVAWKSDLEPVDNHARAIQAYLDHMEWGGKWIIGASADQRGYVAVWAGETE